MRQSYYRLAIIALGALVAVPAHAADQPILGSSFQVKSPGDATKRKVLVKAKEKASPNTIVGDPVANGASLTIRANGTTPSQQILALPQGIDPYSSTSFWSGDPIKGYRYSDTRGLQGPVKSVRIKKSGSGAFTVQVQLTGKDQPLNVVPPNTGTDGCAYLLIGGGGDGYSVQFTGGTVVNKGVKEYSHKKVTVEGTCAPSCSDLIQNGTETDIDCGGGACPTCIQGQICSVGTDCDAGVCTAGLCQAATCTDGVLNGTETDIDCGSTCASDCAFNEGCVANSDCVTTHCSGGLCKCANQLYTFTVNSNVGGAGDSAEWPGGATSQTAAPSCGVTINLPDANIDLVGGLAAPFSINTPGNYSSCVGVGGEDGDGCQPLSCPFLGIGQCSLGRPSCSVALNGSGSAQYFVQCLE